MKALVVFGSTSGNTEWLSEFVRLGLVDAGWEVVVRNARGVDVNDFLNFDLLVFGSSTWNLGNEQGQLQVDWRNVWQKFLQVDLQQKKVAVFGVGHYSYWMTAHAADVLCEGVKKVNGVLVEPVFRVDDVVDLFADSIREWARKVGSELGSRE